MSMMEFFKMICGLKGDSAVKSSACSSRGSKFGSQQPHGNSLAFCMSNSRGFDTLFSQGALGT